MSAAQHPTEALAYYQALEAADRRAVDAHLAGCSECRSLLAAYHRQDETLRAWPALRPRQRAWRPPVRHSPWMVRVGNAVALGGIGALLLMLALYARQAALLAATGTAVPAGLAPEPGLTLPPAVLRPSSPWLPALPWVALALLAVGSLFRLSRRRRWPAAAGALLAGLLLISFVPPLSRVPNPAGLYWRLAGGYSHDPHLLFRNEFVMLGAPERALAPRLDQLIGMVGLSPLDPVQPLAGYEILRVGLHPRHPDIALVTTRFIYADGTSRVYPVPLAGGTAALGGFWRTGWRIDGLERLRSQHLALPGLPFAGEDAPIRLGQARRLEAVSVAAHRLDEANPAHWMWTSVRAQRLVWSPDGESFLAVIETNTERQLWIVPLDGGDPRLAAAGDIRRYGWSPDGQFVVFTRYDADAAAVNPIQPYAVGAVPALSARSSAVQLVTGLASETLPGLSPEGTWFFANGAAWVVPFGGGEPRLALGGLTEVRVQGAPQPAPNGATLAFACAAALCLAPDLPAQFGSPSPAIVRVEVAHPADLAWSPDGQRLAVVARDPNGLRPVELVIVEAAGAVTLSAVIAPRDVTEPPQWTPDGQAIFVQTYPQDGRRIMAVHLPSGAVLDLSQEHWDAYLSLSPNGSRLLLNNGRGGFWEADVLRAP
jgi:hypothetical protein